MKELLKTTLLCLVAGILACAAFWFNPDTATPTFFNDQGQLFFPLFTDAGAPKSIEVTDYDESTATARPLKVEYKQNKWIIPSHFGYPADAEDRLAKTAAALVDLRKDVIVSDRIEDQVRYGVVDPLAQATTNLAGRGKRVTLRDSHGNTLVDLVIGKVPENKSGYRYFRVPGRQRIYMVKTDAEASARFEDWIETDLLKLKPNDIRRIIINRYSINETFGVVQNVENTLLTRENGQWSVKGGGVVRKERLEELTQALANLRIVDVQPKPLGLSRDLKTPEGIRLSPEAIVSLRQRGFFVTPAGQLLSDEGEITVDTANGLQYALRFGEIAPGSSFAAGEAGNSSKVAVGDQGERRYLFVTVNYDAARAQQYAQGANNRGERGKELERELRNRFADWYYIISGAEFKRLRPLKKDLIKG